MKNLNIDRRDLRGKAIYVVEDHSVALKAWAEIRRSVSSAPVLLTLDKHTDTHEPFIKYAFSKTDALNPAKGWEKVADARIETCKWSKPESLDDALPDLKNDEHIRAAIKLGVIEAAFVLSINERRPTRSREHFELYKTNIDYMLHTDNDLPPRPHHYDLPDERVFYLPNRCVPECNKKPHDEVCERLLADSAIESDLLYDRLSHADEMASSLGFSRFLDMQFILDLDLDYLRTIRALNPSDSKCFRELFDHCLAFTIATEPRFVEMERLDEAVSAETSLELVLKLLK